MLGYCTLILFSYVVMLCSCQSTIAFRLPDTPTSQLHAVLEYFYDSIPVRTTIGKKSDTLCGHVSLSFWSVAVHKLVGRLVLIATCFKCYTIPTAELLGLLPSPTANYHTFYHYSFCYYLRNSHHYSQTRYMSVVNSSQKKGHTPSSLMTSSHP